MSDVEDFKSRIEASMKKLHQREWTKQKRENGIDRAPRKKIKDPEKLVEKDVRKWFEKMRFDFSVVESKAVWNNEAGAYIDGQTESGFSDIVGNNRHGLSMWVELKAKGKRSNASVAQVQFLLRKIKTNCFAVVVDGSSILDRYYSEWLQYIDSGDYIGGRKYLKSLLPERKLNEIGEGKNSNVSASDFFK